MNKTSVLELTFYAVSQQSEKLQLIRKFATQTLDKNFDAILGGVFIISPYCVIFIKTLNYKIYLYAIFQRKVYN